MSLKDILPFAQKKEEGTITDEMRLQRILNFAKQILTIQARRGRDTVFDKAAGRQLV